MESRPATMAKAARAGATPTCLCLPEEVAVWEILVRLPPKSLLRCRAACRAWRRATSARDFLLAHHARQPCLPIVSGRLVSDSEYGAARYQDFLAFDHRAADAQLQPVARFDYYFNLQASCDGLLVLCKRGTTCFSICNPVTRAHAPLGEFSFSKVLGLYMHRPTGEYRMLLHRRIVGSLQPKGKIGFYVFALGSDQPPRYIQGLDASSGFRLNTPALVRDSLHWFPVQYQSESGLVLVFDTTTELFRKMRAPVVRPKSDIFEMDGTLGIYSYNDKMQVVYIWTLQNYEHEVWNLRYQVELPVTDIRAQFGRDSWYVSIVSVDGGGVLLLSSRGWMFYVNTEGELVESFHRNGQHLYARELRLKQTLVPHNFFKTLKGSAVNALPFL